MPARRVSVGLALLLTVSPAVLSPPAAAATNWSKAQTLTVVAAEYEFSPDKLTFKRGVPYRLHFANHGQELHEFHAPELFNASELRNPEVLNADKTEIQVAPGKAKDLYFVPLQAGHYPLICPDHDWAGMTGEITVK
jgi:uncharacterized cupredoxin-like copper-binding protein